MCRFKMTSEISNIKIAFYVKRPINIALNVPFIKHDDVDGVNETLFNQAASE